MELPETTTRWHSQRVGCYTDRVRFELTIPFGMPVFETGAFNHSAICPTDCET